MEQVAFYRTTFVMDIFGSILMFTVFSEFPIQSFSNKNGILEFGTDTECNSDVSYIFNNPVSYTLNPLPGMYTENY